MKLEKAYSIELEKNITPEEADYLFQRGDITSKYHFACPDQYCDAQITCANLDKPKLLRKKDPYYKIVGNHIHGCTIAEAEKEQNRLSSTRGQTNQYQDNNYIEGTVRLNLALPSEVRTIQTDHIDIEQEQSVGVKSNNQRQGKSRTQPSKTFSSMIDAFRQDEDLIVQLPGTETLPLKTLFIPINQQDISEFSDELRIYYGKAWFNKHQDGFRVQFTNTLQYDEKVIKPSCFISAKLIEQAHYKRHHYSSLERLVRPQPVDIYILSDSGPRPNVSKKAPESNGKYLNFYLDRLEQLDYR